MTATARQPVLETTGRPELEALERSIQRALDGMHQDAADTASAANSPSYSATAGDWDAPEPTTQSEAITRIAAAVVSMLGTPIP